MSSLQLPEPVSGSGVKLGTYTSPGNPFNILKSWPAPSMPGRTGASCLVQSCGEWQSTHAASCSTRYFPRASRSGVDWKVRSVRGRMRGPMNGRHPTVAVMATANTAPRHKTTIGEIFIKRFMLGCSVGCLGILFDLGNAADMPPAFKRCHKPYFHDFQRQIFGDHSLPNGKNVAVIVLSCQAGSFQAPAKRAANTAHFIRNDCFAISRATQHDPAFAFARSHSLRCGTNEQGIIDRLGAGGAEIDDFMAERSQKSLDFFFVLKPGMVGTDGDSQGVSISCWISACQG